MSSVKKNYHVRLKPNVTIPRLERDKKYRVALVSKVRGERRKAFIIVPGDPEWATCWASQLKALPRCKACESERHKTPRADRDGNIPECPVELD